MSVEVFDRYPISADAKAISKVSVSSGDEMKPAIAVGKVTLWSPETPKLYGVRVRVGNSDAVESYIAFRSVGLVKDAQGRNRLGLNGKPVFMAGPLDQGYWPDGLFTAPTEEAMLYDLEVTKRLGFNTVRKHVKVEPATWYAACDQMGLMVWQDMPAGDETRNTEEIDGVRSARSEAIFRREYAAMVDGLRDYPSIVTWVLFNEAWGQFKTVEMSAWAKSLDPDRLMCAVTGWVDRGTGDMHDLHVYPGPGAPLTEPNRAASLGEFGGLGLPMPENMWQKEGWGYQSYKNSAELTSAFVGLMDDTHTLIGEPGLSSAIYTQTTDVETEVNGLMTYDRRVLKMDEGAVRKAVTALYGPPPVVTTLLATAQTAPARYRFRTDAPTGDWTAPGYDDSAWAAADGGFGQGELGAKPRTPWTTPRIWLRREFNIDAAVEGELALQIYHDEDAEVWLDGKKVATLSGFVNGYRRVRIDVARLGAGRHVLAITCRQTSGGQFIDAGIVRVTRAG